MGRHWPDEIRERRRVKRAERQHALALAADEAFMARHAAFSDAFDPYAESDGLTATEFAERYLPSEGQS